MTDEERLKQIAERCEKATEGPWEYHRHPCVHEHSVDHIKNSLGHSTAVCSSPWRNKGAADSMRFVAHARQDIPWLLSKLSASEKRAGGAMARKKARVEKGRTGRWIPRRWECNCLHLARHFPDDKYCIVCGTRRPPARKGR